MILFRKAGTLMACANQWIGVCLSQAHTFLKTDFLVELDREVRKDGYGSMWRATVSRDSEA